MIIKRCVHVCVQCACLCEMSGEMWKRLVLWLCRWVKCRRHQVAMCAGLREVGQFARHSHGQHHLSRVWQSWSEQRIVETVAVMMHSSVWSRRYLWISIDRQQQIHCLLSQPRRPIPRRLKVLQSLHSRQIAAMHYHHHRFNSHECSMNNKHNNAKRYKKMHNTN